MFQLPSSNPWVSLLPSTTLCHDPLPMVQVSRISLSHLVCPFPPSLFDCAQWLSEGGLPSVLMSSKSLSTRISTEHEEFWGAAATRKKIKGAYRVDFHKIPCKKNLPFSITVCYISRQITCFLGNEGLPFCRTSEITLVSREKLPKAWTNCLPWTTLQNSNSEI